MSSPTYLYFGKVEYRLHKNSPGCDNCWLLSAPWALCSVMAQAGVIGTWCRVTDMFPVFTRTSRRPALPSNPFQEKSVESGSNSMHFGGSVYNMYTSSIGKKFAAGYQHSFWYTSGIRTSNNWSMFRSRHLLVFRRRKDKISLTSWSRKSAEACSSVRCKRFSGQVLILLVIETQPWYLIGWHQPG
jgi:hypothetical protein